MNVDMPYQAVSSPNNVAEQEQRFKDLERFRLFIEAVDRGFIVSIGISGNKKAVASSKEEVRQLVSQWLDGLEAWK